MFYEYLMRSDHYPDETHIGFSEDVNKRLAAHNNGESIHTTVLPEAPIITLLIH